MSKESIIRKLKHNKKLILAFSIAFVVFIVILIPSLIYVNRQTYIDKLYKKAKNGILIEDVYLTHAEVELCDENNPEHGYCLVPVDGFTFKIYAKAGDWYHAHYISWDSAFSPIWFEMDWLNEGRGTNWGSWKYQTFQFTDSAIYTIGVYNYDRDDSGYITFFFIVYTNEYYPPDCPLC